MGKVYTEVIVIWCLNRWLNVVSLVDGVWQCEWKQVELSTFYLILFFNFEQCEQNWNEESKNGNFKKFGFNLKINLMN